MGESAGSMAAPAATTTGGVGSMGNAFNAYQGANDTAMGLGGTTSFGGQDVNINTAYADQKSSNGIDWKGKLKDSLLGFANTKINDIQSMSSFNPNKPIDGTYNESALKQGFKNSDIYNQLMQQQMANAQSSQFKRYNQGV
jgi:hypothetical protein